MQTEQYNAGLRQTANVANQDAALRAAQANQLTAFNTGQYNATNTQAANLANAGYTQAASLANQQTALSLGTTNAQLAQQADLANQQTGLQVATTNEANRLAGVQQNLNQLGAASNYIEGKNAAGVNAELNMMSQYTAMNPLFKNLGLGNTYLVNGLGSQVAGASMDMVGGIAGAKMQSDAAYSAGQSGMWGSIAGGALAAGGAVAGAVII